MQAVTRWFKPVDAKDAPADPGSIELTARRVSITPTRSGLGFAAMILMLLLPALIYKNSLLYLLAFTLLGLFLVSILHTQKTLLGLRLQVGTAQPVFAGDAALLPFTLGNPDAEPRPGLAITGERVLELALPAHQQKTVMLPIAAQRRGWQPVGTIGIASGYPFGLFCARAEIRCDRRVLVYPKPASDTEARATGGAGVTSDKPGTRAQGGEDFVGVRAYQAGDTLRMIHWKAYAKGQGLLSKQFAGDPGGDGLWLDFSHTGAGTVEERLSRMCRWVVDAEKGGLSYGLRLPDRQIQPSRGAGHQALCLEALALYETG